MSITQTVKLLMMMMMITICRQWIYPWCNSMHTALTKKKKKTTTKKKKKEKKGHWCTVWANLILCEQVDLQVFLKKFLWLMLSQSNGHTVPQFGCSTGKCSKVLFDELGTQVLFLHYRAPMNPNMCLCHLVTATSLPLEKYSVMSKPQGYLHSLFLIIIILKKPP